jgi:hypothetical protein
MSTDHDTTRIVRSWLRTDEHESADRVLDAVLDQLDTTRQRRATWWPARRITTLNNTTKLALTAAAVVLVAFLGITYLVPGGANLGGPDPTTAPSPTTSNPTSDADEVLIRAWLDAVNRADRDALVTMMVERPVTDVKTVDRDDAVSYVLDDWCPMTVEGVEPAAGNSYFVHVTWRDNADSTCVAGGPPGTTGTFVIELRGGKVSRIP